MIIDPDREGCTIWEEKKVQHIKGTPAECIERLMEYITYIGADGKRHQDYWNIKIDTAAYGVIYADYFNRMGVYFEEIKPGKVIQ